MKKRLWLIFQFPIYYVLNKRFWQLLFRKKLRTSFYLSQKINKKEIHFTDIQIKLRLNNALFIIVNKTIIPVFHDTALLDITLPLSRGENKFRLLIFGVMNFKKLNIQTDAQSKLKIDGETIIKSKDFQSDLLALNTNCTITPPEKPPSFNTNLSLKKIKTPSININPRFDTFTMKINTNQLSTTLSSEKHE